MCIRDSLYSYSVVQELKLVLCVRVKLTLVLDSTWKSDHVLFKFISTSCSNSSSYSDEWVCMFDSLYPPPFIIPIFFYLMFPFCKLLYCSLFSFCSYTFNDVNKTRKLLRKTYTCSHQLFQVVCIYFCHPIPPLLFYWDNNNNQYQTNLVNDYPLRSA